MDESYDIFILRETKVSVDTVQDAAVCPVNECEISVKIILFAMMHFIPV